MGNLACCYAKHKIKQALEISDDNSTTNSSIYTIIDNWITQLQTDYEKYKTQKIIEDHRKVTNDMKKKYGRKTTV